MKTSAPLSILLGILAGIQAGSAEEIPPLAAPAVLAQLRVQLEQIRSGPELKATNLKRPILVSLVGLHRAQLVSSLGAPDFCFAPRENTCMHSLHWAYFYYHAKPTVRETSGIAEVTIPLQGWAVEIRFTRSGIVNSAAWAWQE